MMADYFVYRTYHADSSKRYVRIVRVEVIGSEMMRQEYIGEKEWYVTATSAASAAISIAASWGSRDDNSTKRIIVPGVIECDLGFPANVRSLIMWARDADAKEGK